MTDPALDNFASSFDISSLSKHFDLDDEGKLNQPPKKQKLSQETSDKENSPNGSRDDNKTPGASPLRDSREFALNKQQLAVAERLARQLHEMEKKKQEEQKKKKNQEESSYKNVRKKVDEQRQKIEQEEKHAHRANLELYKLFNDLQGTAKDLNITFDYPEIVVVGMQSDGKSSFVEGLLGFQFNIVETNIGTRRPLIIQMINSPSKDVPSCRFRKEYPIPDQDPFEDRETAVHDLVDEITRRTNERAGVGSDKVSDVPIILRVEFKECANLTIIDTPGFRLGGDDRLKNEIARMVLKLIEPKHRIIVCLEQSTVEWANSTSRPIVKKIDPDFSRTILVNTKFDNRVKELRNKQSADGYMNGENLPPNAKPFFISMPVRRNLDSNRFKDMIREAFLEDYEKLLEVNFDDKKYLGQLGMFRVKSYLEKLLNEKYQQSLAPTLRTLEELSKKTELELSQIKSQLQQHDIKQLVNAANTYVQSYVAHIENLLAGSIAGEPDKNGEALNEEKLNSGVPEWPDFTFDFDIPNSKLKVYGGAQYARLLNEFEYVAHSREFPVTSLSEIASALGASKSGYCAPEAAAANLVQMKAKQIFLPLIEIVLQRCTYIMKRLFTIAIHVIKHDRDNKSIGILSVYDKFVLEIKNTYELYIDNIESDCKARLKDDFIMFTKIVDWDLLMSSSNTSNNESNATYNYLQPSIEETKQRVQDIMEKKPLNWMTGNNGSSNVRMDEEGYKHVAVIAAKMFSGIRYFFAKYVRNKLNAFFLDPILHDVGVKVVNHFYKLNDKKYEEMFLDGVAELKEHYTKLDNQYHLISQQRDRFKETYYRMKSSSTPSPSAN